MAMMEASHGRTPATPSMRRSSSSGTLRKSGEFAMGGSGSGTLAVTDGEIPKIPQHLSVHCLTRRRKLPRSTGNLHGYMAEDYLQIKWPLPKAFGQEKYGHTLIDIEDHRHLKECAGMSKRLTRLHYDQQIIDLEWRKTYKKLLDAEHRKATLPENCNPKTKTLLDKEVNDHLKYLLELQEQKDMYESKVGDNLTRCDAIKTELKKERDLEDLREEMEKSTHARVTQDSPFWRTKFNYRSQSNPRSSIDN